MLIGFAEIVKSGTQQEFTVMVTLGRVGYPVAATALDVCACYPHLIRGRERVLRCVDDNVVSSTSARL